MLKGLKINTAIIICLAFLFRLFISSTGFISSSDQSNKTPVKGYFAIVTKKEITEFVPAKETASSYSDIEFSEEDSDDEGGHKFHAPLLVESFYEPVQSKVKNNVTAITPSNKHYTYNSSKRHLEFGVFRI